MFSFYKGRRWGGGFILRGLNKAVNLYAYIQNKARFPIILQKLKFSSQILRWLVRYEPEYYQKAEVATGMIIASPVTHNEWVKKKSADREQHRFFFVTNAIFLT